VIKDANGEVTELRCSYDPETGGGTLPEGRKKVKGIIHWVSAKHGLPVQVRVYDRLFNVENPTGDKQVDYRDHLNPESLEILEGLVEPSLADVVPGTAFQFERLGYFCVDQASIAGRPVFNRIVTLRDTWAKLNK